MSDGNQFAQFDQHSRLLDAGLSEQGLGYTMLVVKAVLE